MTAEEFSSAVIKRAEQHGVSYLEVFLDFCDRHGIESERAPKLLTRELKAKLTADARNAHLLKD